MNELNPTNEFGDLLLDLIEAQYDNDYDAGVQALMEATGLTEAEIIDIIEGRVIVEDESLLADIVEAFPSADEGDIQTIISVAEGVDQADRDELIQEIEASEGGEEMMPEEEPEMAGAGAEYGYGYQNYANFANQAVTNQLATEVQELKQQIASFHNAAAYERLNAELRSLDAQAGNWVANEELPPSYKAMLVGNFSSDDERVARFSQIAAENNVPLDTMLFATKYAMGMLKNASKFVEFRDYSLTDEEVAVANFSASLDSLAQADYNAIFGE